ncbi:hypothetical protein RFI_26546 [Reticulomyxa filosa]|uniref:Uncharacterized protein n=1 Tax=Reticulomyxa filosa TaxID=46433 RepID=X6MB11_RETFI|nr:hypothetical protein RFI_26546 [Reticulomyxa filosa]|eukprot:ETO10831.1 hypothetical protein RFI_26546 [Reticulomyxa filosa]
MLDFVNAFKHENEGTVVEAKNLQGLEVQLTYHLGGSNYNYKTVIFEKDDIVVAGKHVGLLRYVGPLSAEQNSKESYYFGLECFEQLKEDEDMTGHSQYFENKYSYNTGVLVPCTEFKCKLTCYDVIRWFVTNSWKLKNQLRQFVYLFIYFFLTETYRNKKKKKKKGMRQLLHYWNKKIKIYKLEKYQYPVLLFPRSLS